MDLVGGDFGILDEVHGCGERGNAAANEVGIDFFWLSVLVVFVMCVRHFENSCFWCWKLFKYVCINVQKNWKRLHGIYVESICWCGELGAPPSPEADDVPCNHVL